MADNQDKAFMYFVLYMVGILLVSVSMLIEEWRLVLGLWAVYGGVVAKVFVGR